MKVIQITNRDDENWGAQYRQYYFGISNSGEYFDMSDKHYCSKVFTFLIDGINKSSQYVLKKETTEIK